MVRIVLLLLALAPSAFGQAFTFFDVAFMGKLATASSGGGAPAGTAYITAFTPGTARNNYTGSVGYFVDAATSFTVTALGRYKIAGNTHTITVRLRSWDDCSVLASVSLDMSTGTDGQFLYATITPVVIPEYYPGTTGLCIESSETSGGDQFYDTDTVVTSTSGAMTLSASSIDCVSNPSSANHAYGPVNFKYTVP